MAALVLPLQTEATTDQKGGKNKKKTKKQKKKHKKKTNHLYRLMPSYA